MLIHKATRGVISTVYTGKNGKYKNISNFPKYTKATFKSCNIPEEEQSDYWVVDDHSSLATAVRLAYPFFDPICDENGEIVAIKKWSKERVSRIIESGFIQSDSIEIAEEIIPDLDEVIKPVTTKKRPKRFISIF